MLHVPPAWWSAASELLRDAGIDAAARAVLRGEDADAGAVADLVDGVEQVDDVEAQRCRLVRSDDVEVVRFDSTLTSAPPTASPGYIELDVFPNPTNPSATIRYTLDKNSSVGIALFDVRGRRVRTIFEGTKPAGRHTLRFDGLDDAGRTVASGVYYVRLMADDGRTGGDRVVIVR